MVKKLCLIIKGRLWPDSNCTFDVAGGKLPLSSRNDIVFLNANTMKECRISIGKKMLVTSSEKAEKVNLMLVNKSSSLEGG